MGNIANSLISDALEAINKEDYSLAFELLNKALEDEGDNFEIYKNLGLCEVNLGNDEGAFEAFKKAYELNNKDAVVVYYYACFVSQKDKERAIQLFQEVIDLRKNYLDAYKNLAMIYIELGQLDLALDTALKAINNPEIENDYSINYITATCYMLKKDFNSAVLFLENALEIEPDRLSVINSLATCYMNISEFEKAKNVLLRAYELESNNSLTLYNLGICYQAQGNFQEALKYFKEAYRLEPTVTMMASLAFCALKAGEAMLASALYQNLVATYPNNSEYRLSYMEALEEIQDYEHALEQADSLLDLDEKNVILTKKKGSYLRKLGRNQESNNVFSTLLNRGKIDVEVYYNLAFNFVELQDFDNAKEMFKKCIILEPNNPYAHKDLGVLYLKMNCYDWAVDEMREAIELEDDVSEFHYALGVSYMMLSNFNDAKGEFITAINLEPENVDALAYLGYIYMHEQDYDKAQEVLTKAIKIEPDNFLAKTHLAKLYFTLKKYQTALELLKDVVEKTPDDETMNMLGVCYLELKDYDCAMGIFYKLALQYPKNHILLYNLAKCEHECNKDKEAVEHLRQALLVYDDFEDALKLLEEIKDG